MNDPIEIARFAQAGRFLHDVSYALRSMRKSPVFTVTVVLTMALGIGGNVAIFTVIRAILLKPLHYREPERLVRVSVDNSRQKLVDVGFSRLQYDQMRGLQSFSELGCSFISTEDITISGGAEPEALKGARVSANFSQILGVNPILGRSFVPDEDTPGGRSVAMISTGLWYRRFASDPLIAGRTVTLDSTPYTIIGVLPAGFDFPFSGIDVWVTRPSEFSAIPPRFRAVTTILIGLARLKPQVTLEQARAELNLLNRQYASAHPELADAVPGTAMRVVRLRDQLVANVRPILWMLFGALGFVLLIACANMASLLLARASSRSREFAIRLAVGAMRGQLISQLLTESLLLAIAGGACAVFLARWALNTIALSNALNLPRAGEVRIDGYVLEFALAVTLTTGVLFGLFPALQASKSDLNNLLREQGSGTNLRSVRGGPLGVGTRRLLVVGQIALSILLLIGAALLLQSVARLHRFDPGFQPANLLTMRIGLPRARYDVEKQRAFFEELLQRIAMIHGITSAAVARSLPMTPRYAVAISTAEQATRVSERPMGQFQTVTPEYFRTLRISLIRGREFTEHDGSGEPLVAIVNESFARRFWSLYPNGENPIGRRVLLGATQSGGREIVGIVADVHEQGLDVDAWPEVYLPFAQDPLQTANLVVRIDGDPLRFMGAVRRQVLLIDPDQSISAAKTMDDLIEASIGPRRFTMILLSTFATVALLLASVGIYGLLAHSVSQRSHELAIRRALGAQQLDIIQLVLSEGLGLTAAGLALGAAGALVLTRVIKSLLFGISTTDPATFAGVALLFTTVALAASYIPAQRATHINPTEALR